MVSVYPIPPPSQDLTHFSSNYYMTGSGGGGGGRDFMDIGLVGMAKRSKDDINLLQIAPFANSGVEDPNKKIRKPYTITKSRESWTEEEHDRFLDALHLFDRDWKKIEAFVGSKTVIQIRSHAQKYFLKVQKNGKTEHVPPPRPKRKASHPYPQKVPKNGWHLALFILSMHLVPLLQELHVTFVFFFFVGLPVSPVSQTTGALKFSSSLLDSGHSGRPDPLLGSRNPVSNAPLSPWTYSVVPTGTVPHLSKDDIEVVGVTMTQNCSGSDNDCSPQLWTSDEINYQVKENQCKAVRVLPDFAQVYSYIGSIFDPKASDHLRRLRKMDPINVETILMLMKNLSVNLVSSELEDHRRLLSSYSVGIENNSMGCTVSSA